MFMTKKTVTAKKVQKNSRALGGWDDDEDDRNQAVTSNSDYSKFVEPISPYKMQQKNDLLSEMSKMHISSENNSKKSDEIINISTFTPISQVNLKQNYESKGSKTKANMCYSAEELSNMPGIQFECKIVQNILEPVGIRVKPNDAILNEFFEDSKNLDIEIIGSLLLCQLYNPDAEYQVKAKSIYTIEHLCKKSVQYSTYFKLHVETIRDSPLPQENTDNFVKIRKGLLAVLGATLKKQRDEDELLSQDFKDEAGYSKQQVPEMFKGLVTKKDSENSDKAKTGKKLIAPIDLKKKVIGPKSNKDKDKVDNNNVDLLNIIDEKPQKAQNMDLLNYSQPSDPLHKVPKFDDLLSPQEPQTNLLI